MQEQTQKSPLTRESIKAALLLENEKALRTGLFLFFIFLSLFVALALLFSWDLILLFPLVFPLIALFSVIGDLLARKKIKSGAFSVLLLPLAEKSERTRTTRRRATTALSCFCFAGFRRVENVENEVYSRATAGDSFFIVTLDGFTVALLYPAAHYDLQDSLDNP